MVFWIALVFIWTMLGAASLFLSRFLHRWLAWPSWCAVIAGASLLPIGAAAALFAWAWPSDGADRMIENALVLVGSSVLGIGFLVGVIVSIAGFMLSRPEQGQCP